MGMNLTIEQMREIVDGAPANINYKYYSLNVGTGVSGWHCDYRDGCFVLNDLKTKIDQHYYGQSEEKELEQYAVLSQEKIEGGAVLVGSFKGFNQWMVDQGFNAIRHANCCRIAYEGSQQSQKAEVDHLKEMNQRYIGKMQEQQDQIAELKAQKERLQKQFNFLLDKNIRDESTHASLKLRVMRVSHLMDKAAENGTECVDIGSLYDALIKDGDLDQSLRGASDQHLTR